MDLAAIALPALGVVESEKRQGTLLISLLRGQTEPHGKDCRRLRRNHFINPSSEMPHLIKSIYSPATSLLSILYLLAASTTLSLASFANVTLESEDGNVEVVVYLPVGLKPTEPTYYVSSRFDHGSMIGSIKLKSHQVAENKILTKIHELFGAKNWRLPHNSQWPESGIGRKLLHYRLLSATKFAWFLTCLAHTVATSCLRIWRR